MKATVNLNIVCEHLDTCSKPDRYWCLKEYSEIFNGKAELIEIVPPDESPENIVFACTECGEEAHFIKVKPEKQKAKSQEPAEQKKLEE